MEPGHWGEVHFFSLKQVPVSKASKQLSKPVLIRRGGVLFYTVGHVIVSGPPAQLPGRMTMHASAKDRGSRSHVCLATVTTEHAPAEAAARHPKCQTPCISKRAVSFCGGHYTLFLRQGLKPSMDGFLSN